MNGIDQLSYCAARNEEDENDGEAEHNARDRSRLDFLEVMPVHSRRSRAASAVAAARSIAATAWPELKPGAAAPLIIAAA